MRLDAFHLPGLDPREIVEWTDHDYGDELTLRFPVLEAGALKRVVDDVRAARGRTLSARPVASIIHALDAAAARLADSGTQWHELALHGLPIVTGCSEPMARLILERMSADWRTPALEGLVAAEFGNPSALDGFVPGPRDGVRSRAIGPEYSLHVFAGNVPGVGVTSLIRSLLVRSAVLAKTAANEPLLSVLYAQALAEVDPDLAACIAVTHWPGGTELDREATADADVVVVYGGADAVTAFRRHAPPGARLVEHGPRLSLGVIGREALASESVARPIALAAASAVATFDQHGCVSPHAFFVESGSTIDARVFAGLLGTQLEALEHELPRGRLDAAEAAMIHAVRATAEFRAISGEEVELIAGPGTSWTVIYSGQGEFEPVCLNRTIRVLPMPSLESMVARLRPYRTILQTVGVAGLGSRVDELADLLADVGISRVTPLDRMPWPPPDWRHDGRGPLQELVTWVDLEE